MATRILSLTLMVSFLLCLSSTTQAGGHIDPSGFTATASSAHETYYGPEFAVNGAGLIDGTFPDEIHHGGHYGGVGNSAEQIWLSLEPFDDAPFGTWFKVDLGQSYALEEVIVWNGSYRGGNSGLNNTDCLNQGDIYYSNSATDPGDDLSGAGWTLFGTAGARNFVQLINTGGEYDPTETIKLGFTAQWFAIDVNSNYGAAAWTALAELQFVGTVAADVADLNLNVVSSGNDLQISWDSQAGKLYNLRSDDDLQPEPEQWAIHGMNENIEATPPRNTLTIPRSAADELFFVIEEFSKPPTSVFEDDFEGGQGTWVASVEDANGNTLWELGTPENFGPPAANSGANCFGTNIGAAYAADSIISLVSPVVDLTTATGADLSYFDFRDIELMFDTGTVNVLDAGDDSLIAEITTEIDGNSDWTQRSHSVPAAALGKNVKFEWRFIADTINVMDQAGWYLDDVNVTAVVP